jgi:hypothetical protein
VYSVRALVGSYTAISIPALLIGLDTSARDFR